MKKNTLFVLIILIFSCKSTKELNQENILGIYEWDELYHVASKIILNRDKTFIYYWKEGLHTGTTKGNWKLKGKFLILNSDKKPIEEEGYSINIREQNIIQKNQLEIKVIDGKEKFELYGVSCILKKDTMILDAISTDINGNCILPLEQNSKTLQINYIGYRTVELPINQLSSNSFIIELKEDEEIYKYFTNRKWKWKRGRIYNPEMKKNKYIKKKYYEKRKR